MSIDGLRRVSSVEYLLEDYQFRAEPACYMLHAPGGWESLLHFCRQFSIISNGGVLHLLIRWGDMFEPVRGVFADFADDILQYRYKSVHAKNFAVELEVLFLKLLQIYNRFPMCELMAQTSFKKVYLNKIEVEYPLSTHELYHRCAHNYYNSYRPDMNMLFTCHSSTYEKPLINNRELKVLLAVNSPFEHDPPILSPDSYMGFDGRYNASSLLNSVIDYFQ